MILHDGKDMTSRRRRLEPQPHQQRHGEAGVQQLPRPAQGHLGQGSQDQRPRSSRSRRRSQADGQSCASGSSCRRTPTPGTSASSPIGTGAFQYKNFVKGDRLELEKFPDYWNGSRPYLDELTFKFVADEAAQVANFLSGDVQYLHDLAVATLPQVEGKQNSKLIPSGIFFEWWQPQMYFGPLKDVKVRQALQWAFDRETGNKVALGGRAIHLEPVREDPVLHREVVAGGRPDTNVRPGEGEEPARRGRRSSNLKLNMMTL